MALTTFLVAVCFLDWFSELAVARYVWLARAIAEDGSVSISRFVENPDVGDIARVPDASGERFVAGTFPGVSMALLPVVIIGEVSWNYLPIAGRAFFSYSDDSWLVFLAVLLLTAPLLSLAAYSLVCFTQRLSLPPIASKLWVAGFVLGSPCLYYAARLHEAAPVIALNACLLGLLSDAAKLSSRRVGFGIGLALGLLDLTNPLAALVAGMGVTFVVGIRGLLSRAGWIAAGLLGPELLLRSYLFVVFGSPLASPYNFLVSPGIGDVWAWRGVTGMITEMIRVIPEIGWGLTFGIRGLFVFAPITLLGIWICLRRSSKDAFARAGLAALVVNVAVIWTFVHGVWVGGTSWGPRYLLPCIPWVFAGAVRGGDARGLRVFVAISIFVTLLGLQFGPAENLWGHLGYFALTGPTTPFARYASWMAETVWVPAKMASGAMNPSLSGQYYAYTHVNGLASWLLLGAGLWWIWRPRPSAVRSFPAGSPATAETSPGS